MLTDLAAVLDPRFLRLSAEFNVRGGIYTTVVCEHRHADWQAPSRVDLPS
jgi:7-cyano-7-deazaguanine reductase